MYCWIEWLAFTIKWCDAIRVQHVAESLTNQLETVRYGICIVEASGDETAARAFVAKVLSRAGQARLVAAGFLPRAKPKPAKR